MMPFNEYKVIEYSKRRKGSLEKNLEDISYNMNLLYSNIEQIKKATDDLTVIRYSKETSRLLEKMTSSYYAYINLQKEIQLINDVEYDTLRKENTTYEKIYSMMEKFQNDEYVEELRHCVSSYEFVPLKGTQEYCECKDYYDYSRVDMGRLIKKELLNDFPNCTFSVVTDWSNWWRRDKCIVSVMNKCGVDREVLEDYLQEFSPRMNFEVKI